MKPTLQLRLGQSLTMTPQLQQAIRLLQLSSIELQAEIQDALDSNMMLELDDEAADGASAEPAPAAETVPDDSTAQSDTENESVAQDGTDIPEELPVDTAWDDIYDAGPARGGDGAAFEVQGTQPGSLRDHLLWQLNLLPASDTDRSLAVAIVDALDDDGYLCCTLDEIRAALGTAVDIDPAEAAAVLALVQSLEPAGVAARDLRECLALQLRQLPAGTPWLDKARELVDQHLQLLADRDFTQLMRRLRLTQDELQQVVLLVQSLNPRPGGQVQQQRTEYIVPDVTVRKEKGSWRVELNTDAVPRLRINPDYAALVRRADSSADNHSLKTHLQEARWFIKSLQSRGETLLRVATCIVERQRAFLEFGEEAMKPLVLHDVAEALGMHESTISRVTNRKYMHTPRGIYELKYFFSSHVGTELGGAASSTAVRALIRKMVSAEEPRRPLSDSRIAEMLSGKGINVARRTVAKYRETLAIPPSNERKRLA